MEDIRNAHTVLVGKPRERIKFKTNLEKLGEGVDWIHPALDRDR
jgi:hypothetical protein